MYISEVFYKIVLVSMNSIIEHAHETPPPISTAISQDSAAHALSPTFRFGRLDGRPSLAKIGWKLHGLL